MSTNTTKPALPNDALFRIERRIAQRADELSRALGVDRSHTLDHWRQAEDEVWKNPDAFRGLEATREAAVR